MLVNTLHVSAKAFLVLLAVALLAGIASAQVNGAIFTSTSTGATINGNIYGAKTDVYLDGGPQTNHDPGLVPDGTYYFQVTDPSGAVLLSADDISCRQVVVTGGRIVSDPSGAALAACTGTTPAGAYHPLGTFNSSNGDQPVQLCPATPSARSDNLGNGSPLFDANNWCDNTPNPGGEYKAWLTPVANYSPDPTDPKCSTASNIRFGFCDSDSKTDNFKVKNANAAYITVCKFNDLDGNGAQDSGEPLIPFWPINATGVDTLTGPLGTVNTQTDETGCVSFSVSTFPNSDNSDTVTLTETLLTGWLETAPLDGTYGQTTVSTFTETVNVKAGDSVTAPNFGNYCIIKRVFFIRTTRSPHRARVSTPIHKHRRLHLHPQKLPVALDHKVVMRRLTPRLAHLQSQLSGPHHKAKLRPFPPQLGVLNLHPVFCHEQGL